MKGLPRSLSRGSSTLSDGYQFEPVGQDVVKLVIELNEIPITVNGATDVGFGTVVVGNLPTGDILFLGATSYVQIAKTIPNGADNVQDTFDGDYSIGSAPTTDATLSGSEMDIIPSTALGAATSGVSPRVRSTNTTQMILDNTDGSLELNLNLLIDDADISADGQLLTVSGELYIVYSVFNSQLGIGL